MSEHPSSNPQCSHLDKDGTWTAAFHSDGCPWCERDQARTACESWKKALENTIVERERLTAERDELRSLLIHLLNAHETPDRNGVLIDLPRALNNARAFRERSANTSSVVTHRGEVMNPPASAAEGAEAGNLNMPQRHGTGAVPQGGEAQATQRPAAPSARVSLRPFPDAWYRGVRSSIPGEPDEYDVECYYGDDPPDESPGWLPLYRRAPDEPSSRRLEGLDELGAPQDG